MELAGLVTLLVGSWMTAGSVDCGGSVRACSFEERGLTGEACFRTAAGFVGYLERAGEFQ